MYKIEEEIVFSNDIKRILNGNNALDFNYQKQGIILPSDNYIEELRSDFKQDVNKIFQNKVSIIKEDDMLNGMYKSILDVYGVLPHCIS